MENSHVNGQAIAQTKSFSGFYYPSCIWLDKRLKAIEKNLIAEVYSLEQLPLGCIASNEHFAARLNINARSVSRHIKSLIRRGYLVVVSFDGRHRKLKTNFDKLDSHQPDKTPGQGRQSVEPVEPKTTQSNPEVDKICLEHRQNVPTTSTDCRPTIVNTNIITKEKNYRDSLVKDQLRLRRNPGLPGLPTTKSQ